MSLNVRISLGSYDFAHPGEQQTQVYVSIPEVARVTWMLPAGFHAVLTGESWPQVVESARAHYEEQRVVSSDRDSAAARQRVCEWLAVDENYDALTAAWEQAEARRHPVARKLLAELERGRHLLSDRTRELVEMEADRNRWKARADAARAVHSKHADSEHCQHDGESWPCPTLAALGAESGGAS